MLFDKEQVLEAFDDLVGRQIILYGQETVVKSEDRGFQVREHSVDEILAADSIPYCSSNSAYVRHWRLSPRQPVRPKTPRSKQFQNMALEATSPMQIQN